jgi:Tfp pilus assembly protein PilF
LQFPSAAVKNSLLDAADTEFWMNRGEDKRMSRPLLLYAAGIASLTALTFAPVRDFDFVNYDDLEFVVENPHVATGISLDNVRWALENPYGATGGPVTWLSHMFDAELFGMDAGAHHVTSLALHVLNAVLLLIVLARITGAPGPSALVAALFAVHPLHVESVAWISQRKDVVSTLFWILAIAAYAGYVRRPSAARYGLVAGLVLLGLLSKPMVATLPFVLLLLDVWPFRRLPRGAPRGPAVRRLIAEKAPLILMAAGSLFLTFEAQRALGAVTDADRVPLAARLSNAVVSYCAYLAATAWPHALVPFYPYRVSIPPPTVALCGGALLGLTAAALAAWRRAPYATVGWLWYAGTLLPVIGIVQVGGHAMADRFTYVPSIGLFIAVAWGATALLARMGITGAIRAAIAVAAVLACAGAARAQAMHWRNGVTLWTHTTHVQPDNARAHANLGVALARAGNLAAAAPHYEEALRLYPRDARTWNNLGLALAAAGRRQEAIARYREAIRLEPGYTNARINLANLLDEDGQGAEAIGHYQEALRAEPGNVLARANLAIALGRNGRVDEAIPQMLDVIRRNPTEPQWHFIAAMMWLQKGQPAEAIPQLQEALRLNPGYEDARAALARLR